MRSEAYLAAEQAARWSYGRLVAILASRSGDIASAEEALAMAFAKALGRWPDAGVPDNPDAWLLTAARNQLTDMRRRDARLVDAAEALNLAGPTKDLDALPDERLNLMLVCAHEAIDVNLRAPLMLQTVLGLEAQEIARAFLSSPSAMAQRLVRVKAKIRDARIPFDLPDRTALPSRVQAVTEAIYAAFSLDWLDPTDALTGEATYLASLLAQSLPDDPEPLGLLALMGFIQARSEARIVNGALVPLHLQNTDLWNKDAIDQALRLLGHAKRMGRLGRFQLEAAIQSVHAHRARTGLTDWQALDHLYAGLGRIAPSQGAILGHAAVIAQLHGPKAGLAALERIDPKAVPGFQAYHATRAHLLKDSEDFQAAAAAFDRAIALATHPASRAFLEAERKALFRLI